MKLITWIFYSLSLILIPFSALHAQTFNEFAVFGDSLSDSGNMYKKSLKQIPKSPPYDNGRFANGPVWPEYFVDLYPNVTLVNKSYAAAKTGGSFPAPGLVAQIKDYFEGKKKIDDRVLFAMLIGANNYNNILGEGQQITKLDVNMAISDIAKGINELASKGAANIIIFSLPDLGLTPRAYSKTKNGDKTFQKSATEATLAHNKALAALIVDLEKSFNLKNINTRLIPIDFNEVITEMLNEVLTNPTSQKYFPVKPNHQVNITEACYTGDYYGKNAKQCQDPDEYVFWDSVHPTTLTHKAAALLIKQTLEADYGLSAPMMMKSLSMEEQKMFDSFNRVMNN